MKILESTFFIYVTKIVCFLYILLSPAMFLIFLNSLWITIFKFELWGFFYIPIIIFTLVGLFSVYFSIEFLRSRIKINTLWSVFLLSLIAMFAMLYWFGDETLFVLFFAGLWGSVL